VPDAARPSLDADWAWLGCRQYGPVAQLQEELRDRIRDGVGRDTLLMLEHSPVITLGRHAKAEHVRLPPAELEAHGIELHRSSRGGDVTYHGPGQLVGYPIFRLHRGVRAHVEAMAASVVELLREQGVAGEWRSDRPGVWVKDNKICAFGVQVRRGIATHGFALNVHTELAGFSTIVPCGLTDAGVTSIARETGNVLPVEAVARSAVEILSRHFERRFHKVPAWQLPSSNTPH
jgi:lipoyl(octanoyl) transferase